VGTGEGEFVGVKLAVKETTGFGVSEAVNSALQPETINVITKIAQ
jgi:hypothetical protein